MLKFISICALCLACWQSTNAASHSYIECDSITNNLQDFAYLTAYTEANYAAFPAIMKGGFGAQYSQMKDSLKCDIETGKMGIKQATYEYAYWFNSQFDAHYYVDDHLFWRVYKRKDTPDYAHLMEYAPQTLSTRINKHTYLIRIPSCAGKNPTNEWVANAVSEFMGSKCENLIIDIRGNSGGSDEIWAPLISLLIDHKALAPEAYWFRNTYANRTNNSMRDWLKTQVADFDKSTKSFLLMGADEDDDDTDEIPPHDTNIHIAFIIDRRTASSAETILRIARNFTDRERYAIYGKENSAGAAETGNLVPFHLPHSRIQVYYPISLSSSFLSGAEQHNGASGIRPDVKIDLPYPAKLTDNIDSWTQYVAKQMQTRKKH